MKFAVSLSVAFAAAMLQPAFAAETGSTAPAVHEVHHPVHRHYVRHLESSSKATALPASATAQVAPAAPTLGLPFMYPEKQGDEDGLSRKRSDCNKGCVDGPY